MIASLRSRLLVWYTALVAVVMTVFGAMVCYVAWRARVNDVDAELRVRVAALARALRPAEAGTFDLVVPPAAADEGTESFYHALWTDRGTIIDESNPELAVPRPSESGGRRTRDGRRELFAHAEQGVTVLVGRPLDDVRAEVWALALTMLAVGAAAVGLALAGGWWLVGRALTPIDRIGRTARAMVDGDFAARVPIERVESELGQLARALNDAFDRLHESLERQRRFTADASHELRTPLTTISTEAQWALGRDRSAGEYRHSIESCQRAAHRMQRIVERLLALARAESGAAAQTVAVPLDVLVRKVAEELRPLAAARRVTVRVTADAAVAAGDPERFLDAITNVVTNAVQYNVQEGSVDVDVRADDGWATLRVRDTGIGIDPDALPRVFEPFFRADPARSRDAGGAGLGLAVTRAIVEAAGGTVACESAPGLGTTVCVRLPTWPPSPFPPTAAASLPA
jgi:two-component system OmpR family sensor kinase